MTIQFLTNEEAVKGLLPFSENLAGNYISSAIFEAQEVDLKRILGAKLLKALKDAYAGTETVPTRLSDLNDAVQPYLIYMTAVHLIPKARYKVGNLGVATASDEKVTPISESEMNSFMENYQAMADAFCYDLQGWIWENREDYPELDTNQCHEIRANLDSIASCGVFLGGPRGKRL